MSRFSYQWEEGESVLGELEHHFAAHWAEYATLPDRFKMDIDIAGYRAMNKLGRLHIVTVREITPHSSLHTLVGYHVHLTRRHPHRNCLCSQDSVLYVQPYEPLVRLTILRNLIEFSISELTARGVEMIFSRSKNSHAIGGLLGQLGFEPVETVYMLVPAEKDAAGETKVPAP